MKNPEIILYLIRHGETDWNRQEKLQGHSDLPLNDLGRDQAMTLAKFTSSLDVEFVATSDLLRARETAGLAFPQFSEFTTDPRLREVHLGEAEGMTRQDLEPRFGPDIMRAWFSSDEVDMHRRFPGGESRAEALQRVTESLREHCARLTHSRKIKTEGFLSDLWRGPQDGDQPLPAVKAAFVTHGLVIRTFTQAIVGSYRPEFRAPNCAIFEFHYFAEKFHFAQIILPD